MSPGEAERIGEGRTSLPSYKVSRMVSSTSWQTSECANAPRIVGSSLSATCVSSSRQPPSLPSSVWVTHPSILINVRQQHLDVALEELDHGAVGVELAAVARVGSGPAVEATSV